jgi:FKBP-type peptidyl-prolyl cis-trans isomerase FkpA
MIKKYFHSGQLVVAAGVLIFLVSCNPAAKYEKTERESIATYIDAHPGFTKEASGLYYMDVTVGTGVTPATHDTAFLRYTGKFLSGTVFDTNVGSTYTDWKFPVGEGYAIAGVDEAVNYMKVGGKATLVIPSSLAYGSQGYYTISGYTPLLFDIELVKVTSGPTK